MIKIFSLGLFVALFIWTWFMFNSPSTMGVDIHAGIQSKLTIMIEDSIKAKKPSMTNFKLNKMYTEKLDAQKVKAYFSYQFDDVTADPNDSQNEAATQNISGEAILTKALSEDPLVQKWIIQSVKTDQESLEFKEGATITSDGSDELPDNQ